MLLRNINSSSQFRNFLNQQNNVPNLFLIFGEDTFIRDSLIECCKNYHKDKGFYSIISFNADNFKWEFFQNELLTHSLLADSQLIILNFADKLPPKEITSNIDIIIKSLTTTKSLILSGPHLTKDKESSVWFKKLTKINNLYLPFYKPQIDNLPLWFSNEANTLNLNLDYEAAYLLADFFEGNLSGGIQALQTCKMQGKSFIKKEDLITFTNHSNRFSAYEYTDALLQFDFGRALKILKTLKETDTEISLIIYQINQLTHFLLAMKQAEAHQDNIKSVYAKHKIQPFKQNLYKQFCNQVNIHQINALIKLAAIIQKSKMSFDEAQTWRYIEAFTTLINNQNLLSNYLECIKK